MAKKSKKQRVAARQIAKRKDAVDVFLNGIPVLSVWKDEYNKTQAKAFQELVPGDYEQLAWSLNRLAMVLIEMDKARIKTPENKVVTLPAIVIPGRNNAEGAD